MQSSKRHAAFPVMKARAMDDPPVQVEVTSLELSTLITALDALLRERTMAYQIASDYLAQRNQEIDQLSFGISNIIRIKRALEKRLDPADRV